jgi:hypothetical protein
MDGLAGIHLLSIALGSCDKTRYSLLRQTINQKKRRDFNPEGILVVLKVLFRPFALFIPHPILDIRMSESHHTIKTPYFQSRK